MCPKIGVDRDDLADAALGVVSAPGTRDSGLGSIGFFITSSFVPDPVVSHSRDNVKDTLAHEQPGVRTSATIAASASSSGLFGIVRVADRLA